MCVLLLLFRYQAVQSRNQDMAELLLAHGFDPLEATCGRLAIELALVQRQWAMAKLLIEHMAPPVASWLHQQQQQQQPQPAAATTSTSGKKTAAAATSKTKAAPRAEAVPPKKNHPAPGDSSDDESDKLLGDDAAAADDDDAEAAAATEAEAEEDAAAVAEAHEDRRRAVVDPEVVQQLVSAFHTHENALESMHRCVQLSFEMAFAATLPSAQMSSTGATTDTRVVVGGSNSGSRGSSGGNNNDEEGDDAAAAGPLVRADVPADVRRWKRALARWLGSCASTAVFTPR
jgi:hypothetical protein